MTSEFDVVYQEIVDAYSTNAQAKPALIKIQRAYADGSMLKAYEYARLSGMTLGDSIVEVFEKYFEDADVIDKEFLDETVGKALYSMSNKVGEIAQRYETAAFANAGMNINGINVGADANRIDGLTKSLSESTFGDFKTKLPLQTENIAENTVDRAVNANSKLASSAGIKSYVVRSDPGVRTLSGGRTCQFCSERAGYYEYPFPRKIFERHDGCKCEIETSYSTKMRVSGHGFTKY